MKKYIYIHTPFLNGWEEVYSDILSFIKEEDKKDVISIVLGGTPNNLLVNPIFLNYPVEYNECATLQMMWNHASFNTEKSVYYYAHLKGVTRPLFLKKNCDAWRRFMCYFLFNNIDENEQILQQNDSVGCFFVSGDNPHYSGNFWACTSDHLKKLSYPKYDSNRLIFEMWIASTKGKYYSHYPNNTDRYLNLLDHTKIKNNFKPEIFIIK